MNPSEPITAVQKMINTAVEFLVQYSFQIVGALIILIVGNLIANWAAGLLSGAFKKKNFDITLARFVTGIVRMLILAFAILIALGAFGITIAPFVAALGALAFGASIAVQGPLSNYGAGVSIILSRPFVVGDTIMVSGVSGVVKEVKLACTQIYNDEEGVLITIPNKDVVGQILHNSKKERLAEGVVGISYSSNPDKAIQIIRKTLQGISSLATSPVPQIGIKEFGDSSINIEYRYRIPSEQYYQSLYSVNLAVFHALSEAGIQIPFPQREVRMLQ